MKHYINPPNKLKKWFYQKQNKCSKYILYLVPSSLVALDAQICNSLPPTDLQSMTLQKEITDYWRRNCWQSKFLWNAMIQKKLEFIDTTDDTRIKFDLTTSSIILVYWNAFGKKYGTKSNTFLKILYSCVCHGKEQQKGKKKRYNPWYSFDAVSSDRMNNGKQNT